MEIKDGLYKYYPVARGYVRVQVDATSEARIALTSAPRKGNPMVEIIIGGWNNSKSVIRRDGTEEDKAAYEQEDGMLNPTGPREFFVQWQEGRIRVGREGERDAFFSWTEPEPFPITSVGVCTGWGVAGTWRIDGGEKFESPADNMEYIFSNVYNGSLEFEYRGSGSCFVSLTGEPGAVYSKYEIVIGGAGNTASFIRYYHIDREEGEVIVDTTKVPTSGILNTEEHKKFLIDWAQDHVRVRDGSTPEATYFMESKGHEKLHITHFGIRSSHGAFGDWRFYKFREMLAALTAGDDDDVGVWVPTSGDKVPPGAISGGKDSNETLYIARAQHGVALIPGKLAPSHGAAFIAAEGREHIKTHYEVLVGGTYDWVKTSGKKIPKYAFPAGESEYGVPLFVGRVTHDGSLTIGKVDPEHGRCYIPYGSQQHSYDNYETLVVGAQ